MGLINTASGDIYVPDGLFGDTAGPGAPWTGAPQQDASDEDIIASARTTLDPAVLHRLGLGPAPQQDATDADIIAQAQIDNPAAMARMGMGPTQAPLADPWNDPGTLGGAGGGAVGGAILQSPPAIKQRAAEAAYNASPEGQIANATQGATGILKGQGDIASQAGDIASQESAQNAADLAERNTRAQEQRDAQEKQAKERADGMAKHIAAYDKATEQEATYKIDDGRRWTNLSTGNKVLAGISVILSGLGDALQHRNGPNPAIQMIMGAIKDDVDAQVRERDQLGKVVDRRRNSIDMYRQQTGELREAGNLKLAEEYKRTADQLELTAAKYASPKAKLNAMNAAAEFDLRAQNLLGSSAEARSNRDLQRGQLKVAQSHAGAAWFNAKEGVRHNKMEELLAGQDRDDKVAAAIAAGNSGQAKLIQDRALGGEVTEVKDKDGNVVDSKVGLITMKDGSVFIPKGTEATITAFQAKHDAAVQLVQTLDEIRKIGPEWLSDTANSEKLQQLKQLMGDARLQAISAKGLGVPTGHDIELAEDFIGTSDPTRRKASLAGLQQGRDSIVRDHNVELRNRGLDKPWAPPDLGKKGAAEEAGESEFKSVLADPTLKSSNFIQARGALEKFGEGLTDSQAKILDNIAAGTKSKNAKTAERSWLQLQEAANTARLPGVQAYAKRLLEESAGLSGAAPTGPEPTGPEP